MKGLLSISLILLLLVACDDENDDTRPENEVWMSTNSFLPASLEVSQGTTIRWLNNSSVTHNLVSETGLFNELLNPGGSFSYTFDDDGVFNYECTLHPGMTGSIIVGNVNGSQNGGEGGDDEDGGEDGYDDGY